MGPLSHSLLSYIQMEEMSLCRNAQLYIKGVTCLSPSLVLILLAFPAGCTQGCPSSCDCRTSNGTVVCRGRELAAPPEGVPPETKALDLSGNLIAWVRPGQFSGLSKLEELDLSGNLISHLDAGALDGLPGLRGLRLRGNRLKTVWPGVFGATPGLAALDVRGNPLAVLLDETFGALPHLRRLELGEELVYVAPRAFVGLSGLQRLTLGMPRSSSLPTAALSRLGNLTALRFRGLDAAALRDNSFQRLPGLRVLEIERWPRLVTLTPDSLRDLNLTSLSITACNLTSVPYDSVRHMVYLQYFDLSHNPIAAIRGDSLGELVRLRELRLVGGKLSAIEPSAFRGLAHLRVLNVSGNRLQTLEESAFHPGGVLATLGLDANPLACDCRLSWIVARRAGLSFGQRQPVCDSPPPSRGRALGGFGATLPPGSFACSRARIPSKAVQLATVGEGETVSFRCRAEGDPTPAIRWSTPRGRTLSSGQPGRLRVRSDGALEIWYAQVLDSGAYQCTASNAAGSDATSALLRVRRFTANVTLGLSTRQPAVNASRGSRPPLGPALDEATLSV
ncbi:hypothetical protein scyTo_0025319, partial [Scyliorhinus torazame]|nr:hypothetical protein [Scyliorhinus torazame]